MRPSQPSLSRSSTIQHRGTGTQRAFTREKETRTEAPHWHELQNVRSLGSGHASTSRRGASRDKDRQIQEPTEFVWLLDLLSLSRDVGRIAAHEVDAVSLAALPLCLCVSVLRHRDQQCKP